MNQPKPVLCIGEALVDVVIRGDESSEHVGGSLLNVAAGLAQLGYPAEIACWVAHDARGEMIIKNAAERGVTLAPGSDGAERTMVAYAHLDEEGRASYEFDLSWDVPEIPCFEQYSHLHVGSLAATVEPGGTKLLQAVKKMAVHGTVSYDPNARPAIMGSPDQVLGRIEELIALSDVVKASDEDISWLYPNVPVENVIRRWATMGPGLVVATRGPWGAYAVLSNDRDMLVIDPLNVPLADTVGAGDSFMAGMISGLLEGGLVGSEQAKSRLRQARWPEIQTALHRATITSGLTVSRPGAYAPNTAEVNRVITAQPKLA